MADLTLTITIPDAKLAEAREGFLAECAKPPDFEGTDREWLEEVLRRFVNRQIRRGLQRIASDDAASTTDYTVKP